MTARVRGSITETSSVKMFATKSKPLRVAKASPAGEEPGGLVSVATTVCVARTNGTGAAARASGAASVKTARATMRAWTFIGQPSFALMRRAPTEPRRVRWRPCCLGSAPALLVLFLPPSASLLTMALARDFSPLARGCVGVNGRSIPVHSLLACRLDRRPVHPGARRTCDAQLPIELAATCYFVIGLAMVPMAVRISAGGQRSLPHVAHLAQTAGHAFRPICFRRSGLRGAQAALPRRRWFESTAAHPNVV